MINPFTRAQALENTAFLRALARTGNARLAAREVGKAYGTMQHRRARHPVLAQRWEAAVATAQARLARRGGVAGPRATGSADPHRTSGGEPVVVVLKNGRLQQRRAQPGKLTQACEQAFLLALSATANVSLSAAAAGASEAAFYRRRRRNPGFAREMRMALQQGFERIEMTLVAGFAPDAHADDAWRHNEPPPIPAMTPAQALQLLYLHQKEAWFWSDRPDRKRRNGESYDAHAERMSRINMAMLARETDDRLTGDLLRNCLTRNGDVPMAETLRLPALDQVGGWSRATGRTHDADVALFGGWRLAHMLGDKPAGGAAGGG